MRGTFGLPPKSTTRYPLRRALTPTRYGILRISSSATPSTRLRPAARSWSGRLLTPTSYRGGLAIPATGLRPTRRPTFSILSSADGKPEEAWASACHALHGSSSRPADACAGRQTQAKDRLSRYTFLSHSRPTASAKPHVPRPLLPKLAIVRPKPERCASGSLPLERSRDACVAAPSRPHANTPGESHRDRAPATKTRLVAESQLRR